MARERDPDLWQAWRNRLRRCQGSLETVADFCRRERVSVAAFYQWKRKLSLDGDQRKMNGDDDRVLTTAARVTRSRRSQPQFIELVVPAQPATMAATISNGMPLSAGCVEIRLPNGVCARLASADHQAVRGAILAAAQIGGDGDEGDASC